MYAGFWKALTFRDLVCNSDVPMQVPFPFVGYRPGIRFMSWIKVKHFQTRLLALLGWLLPEDGA